MDSGQPPSPRKIKANSSTENWGHLLQWIQANPPPGKIKANSSTEN